MERSERVLSSLEATEKLDTRTEILSDKRLEELSNDPQNIVYQYEHDTVDRVKPASEVKMLIHQLRETYFAARAAAPARSDTAIRNDILETSALFRDFEKTHPRFFDQCTDRDTTPEHMQSMFTMLNIRKLQEAGKYTEEQAQQLVSTFLLDRFKRGPAPSK